MKGTARKMSVYKGKEEKYTGFYTVQRVRMDLDNQPKH